MRVSLDRFILGPTYLIWLLLSVWGRLCFPSEISSQFYKPHEFPAPKSCSEIDYRKQLPPVRDQDSAGWCYAFTAADLVSFKVRQSVSPIDIAVSTERSKESYFQALSALFKSGNHDGIRVTDEGDNASTAIMAAAQKGFCRDRDLPSDDYRYARYRSNLKDFLNQIGELQHKIDRTRSANTSRDTQICQARLHQFFPNISPQDMADILNSFAWRPLIDQMVDATCKNRIKANGIQAEYVPLSSVSVPGRIKELNSILASGRPAGIQYNADIVADHTSKVKTPFGHDSSIVGRHWDRFRGECDFILRNSWGSDCASQDFYYECDQAGYVYISQATLARAVGGAYYVK